MARPSQTAKTRRGQVSNADQKVGYNVVAPSNVSAGPNKALQLANALGVAVEGYTQVKTLQNQQDVQQGIQDAQTGNVDEEAMAREAYYNGVTSVRAEADFYQKQSELQKYLEQNVDVTQATLGDVNEEINKFYAENYGEGTDETVLRTVAPLMQKTRGKLLGVYQEQIARIEEQKNQGALYSIANEQLAEGAGLDWNALNERALMLMSPSEANDMLVSVATNLAIEQGRPDLLESMPDKWANGVPTPKRINKYDDVIRNAKVAAENQMVANQNAIEKREREALKNLQQQTEADTTQAILEGRDMSAQLSKLVQDGTMDPTTARTLYDFNKTYQNDMQEDVASDAATVSQYRIGIYEGSLGQNEIIQAYSRGDFGSGAPAEATLKELLAENRVVRDNRLSNPRYRQAVDQLQLYYPVEQDIMGSDIKGTQYKQAEVMERLRVLVSQGDEPDEAVRKIRQEIQPYDANQQQKKDNTLTTIKAIASGESSAPVTPEMIIAAEALYSNGEQISREEYEELLSKFN